MFLLIAALLCAALLLGGFAALAITGRIGTRRAVRSPTQAHQILTRLTEQAVTGKRAAMSSTLPATAAATPPAIDLVGHADARTTERTRRHGLFLDAAIPGGLAAGIGLYAWLTPDPAAIGALEHMTGTDITSALDFHRTFQDGGYQWWTDGSLNAWRGHVGEHQIAEQVTTWAGDGQLDMPGASNFAGADLSMFGESFQVKFVEDFASIDNKHGDVLIVPEDTAGVPDDALHIDFTQPFDPSLLEGHDVIVAEGLTLAGAEDAWADAIGRAAGGIDADVIGDAGLEALVPGAGALIRVAASGYRRRSGLADPELRARASKLIARDAAYGVGGAGVGGTVGAVLGAGVDILSMGATAGFGTYLGGIAGTAAGGMFGAAKSREADRNLMQHAHAAVQQALTAYSTTADSVTAQTHRDWTAFVAALDEEAEANATMIKAQVAKGREAAQRDLNGIAAFTADERDEIAWEIETIAGAADGWTRRDRHLAAKIAARIQTTEANAANTEKVLVEALRIPGAELVVRAWLDDRVARRVMIVAALDAFNTAHAKRAMGQRVEASVRLNKCRHELRAHSADQLEPLANRIKSTTRMLKQEIKVHG